MNYLILQSVNMLMYMVRLVSQVSFQPRLAVLAKTLGAQMNDLSHFLIVFIFVNSMFASVCECAT